MKYHLSFALTLIFAAELQDRHIPALSCRLRLARLFHRQREVDDRDQNTATVEGAVATGTREMIVVLRNSQTLHYGSMYSISVTTGNWEGFIAHDLVACIDSHCRIILERMSRGFAGHSMGS